MTRVPPLPLHLDSYEGWEPSTSAPKIARIHNKISAADMWTHFISKRRPVIINGLLNDPEWKADKWTNLDYLRSVAGETPVKIEPVHPDAGHFGTSVKRKKVKFSEFIDILQDDMKAGKWYLTTQYEEEDEAGQSSHSLSAKSSDDSDDTDSDDSDIEPELDNVLPAPTNALSNDFPAKPEMLGDLVLQQCNLWLGNSKEGKSSGLHHDFHDNLYILLSGYKRFLLFPPSAHRYLHPRGFVERVHPNGLIVYAAPGELPSYVPVRGRKAQLPIRPDGLVPSDAARWRVKARLRVKRAIDEAAAADAGEGQRNKSQRKGKAKQTRAQELAEEALLQAEAELRICRMDEEGIDPEDDTSDEDEYDEDDLDGIFSSLVGGANGADSDDEEHDEQDDSNDEKDDNDVQIRRLLASLPPHMKQVALSALAGDQASGDKLRLYVESVAEASSPEAENVGGSGEDDEAEDNPDSPNETGLRASEELQDMPSDDDEETSDEVEPAAALSTRLSRKRKQAAASEPEDSDEEGVEESDTVESDGADLPVKRVKVASQVESIDFEGPSGDSEADSQSDEEEDESSEEDDSDEPAFPTADSGSEFGDVDEGEAELERLLAMAQDQDDDTDATPPNDDDEPQSFSRIPPHVLHRCFDVPDDPSRHTTYVEQSGGRAKNDPATMRYGPLQGCPPPIEVFLKPGQMLYLPASWYHEVTSSSLPPLNEDEEVNGEEEPESKVHMALNYWFHPPDALEFEPVEPRQATRSSNEVTVPGLGVAIGDSALEHRRDGTGTHERPYRDAEVWDEVAHAVAEQIKLAREAALSQ